MEKAELEETFEERTEEYYLQETLTNEIWGHLRKKPMLVQKAIYLHFYLNLSIAETAIELQCTESSIKEKRIV